MPTSKKYSVDGRISIGLAEVRVEVLWGRAYLALLDGCMTFTRDGKWQNFADMSAFGTSSPVLETHWFFDEGHAACVWDVAERAAHAAGVESMRVDVFMDRGRPDGCVLNENSLSSGAEGRRGEDHRRVWGCASFAVLLLSLVRGVWSSFPLLCVDL